MAKKLQEAQIVDLGTHVIKAVHMSAKAGKPSVVKAHSVVLTDSFTDSNRYFNDLRAAIDAMVNSGLLDKKVPVFFVVGETLMPISIAYLNNQKPDAIDLALEDSLNKFVAAEGTSSMEVTLKKSFRLREKAQGPDMQVVAAHVYARYDVLKELQEICLSRKIPFGGAYAKLFAFQAMFQHGFADRPDVRRAITAIVDVGYNNANVVAFKEGDIVFHKSLHIGGRDYFNELRNLAAEKAFFQLSFSQFTEYMARVGSTDDPSRVGELGLQISDPAPFVAATASVSEELCTKIRLSLDYFSTVSATDFNTSMATVMAVRKGAEHIFFTGGIVATEGFMRHAREELAEGIQELDLLAGFGGTPEGTVPSMAYSVATGAALIALGDQSDEYNMGLLLGGGPVSVGASDSEEGFLEKVPKWAHVIALAALLYIGWEYYGVYQQKQKLNRDKDVAQEDLADARDFFLKFARARREQAQRTLSIEFAREVLLARPPWVLLLKQMAETSAGLVKLTRLQADVGFPSFKGRRDAENEIVGADQPLSVAFKLAGEARSRDQVFAFAKQLTEGGYFRDLEQPQLVDATGNAANPFNTETARVENSTARFFFEIRGNIRTR